MHNMYEELKKTVCRANVELERQKLVTCTWGNVNLHDFMIRPTGSLVEKNNRQDSFK